MAEKHRYIMLGMFDGTDGEIYDISIPSPLAHATETEAMTDGSYGYRFMLIPEINNEPIIAIYEKENFSTHTQTYGENANNADSILTWVEGKVIGIYTFDQFKAAGGSMRMLRPEAKEFCFLDDSDFRDTDKTFKDCLGGMEAHKLYYIDNEAYSIRKE